MKDDLLKIRVGRLSDCLKIDRKKLLSLFVYDRADVSFFMFFIGILIAFYGSLTPWFLWPISGTFPMVASVPIALAWLMSSMSDKHIFTRKEFLYPTLAYILIAGYMAIVNANNLNGFLSIGFNVFIFLSIFALELSLLEKLMNYLTVSMAVLLLFSIPCFILYLLGFPLPFSSIENEDLMYSYYNYYFFLLDNRFITDFIPRFHSVFLEPAHLGSACVFLLLTQFGKWRKWYNLVLIVAIIMTFSLTAYILFLASIFFNQWVRGKRILIHIVSLTAVLVAVGVFSYYYRNGDNMVNTLILERFEVDDTTGELVANNRVTEEFDDEFDDFIGSSDILFGREYDLLKYGFGNSGYRVSIYDFGILYVFFLLFFYIMCSYHSTNRRAVIAMFAIGAATFWARSSLLGYYDFLPLYAMAYMSPVAANKDMKKDD